MHTNEIIDIMPKKGVFLRYSDEEKSFSLTYKELRKYWSHASEDNIEYVSAYLQDELLLFNAWVASGQGGIVAVLNKFDGNFIHISEGAFAVTTLIYKGYVISLCDITQWGVKPQLELIYSRYGIKDAYTCAKSVPCDIISSFYSRDMNDLFLYIKEGILVYGHGDKIYDYDIDSFLRMIDEQA